MSHRTRSRRGRATLAAPCRAAAGVAGALLLGGVLAAGCSPAATTAASPAAGRSGSPSAAGAAASPAARAGRLRKIVVIMEENHSIQQVFPRGMPYLWSLARRYAYASDWSDVAHPSLPNYLAIFGGSDFNVPHDCAPAPGCTYPGPSVFGQALALGEAAKAYEESMPYPCDPGFAGQYDVNHNPWAYFPSEASACRADDVPAGTPAGGALAGDVRGGTLPDVGLITPDLQHDAHDGTPAQADAWLRAWMPVLMSGPDWRSGRLAIAVVFDEGVTTEQVPFVLMAPGLSGVRISEQANQYALTRLIDQVIGAPPLRQAGSATSLTPLLGSAR
ncbi:MAG TPA: alkaline phosphatase family protein [Streptosporangiaceae bacterium]|nr:alkaline phosphatase family protein [Streptosporangiaceae bacterium]